MKIGQNGLSQIKDVVLTLKIDNGWSFVDLREAFNLFVKSKSGKVSANDIGVLLKTVGQSCTDDELHAIAVQASEGKSRVNHKSSVDVNIPLYILNKSFQLFYRTVYSDKGP